MLSPCTVLTHPLPGRMCVKLRKLWSPRYIGGHYAVTRSLFSGLDQIKARYNSDPAFEFLLAPVVHVLCDPAALEYAIRLKQKRKIRFLSAGPNISVLPSWNDNLLAMPEVDVCIVPSDWVKTSYEEDCPGLAGRIRVWAAGVDERYWNPDASSKKTKDKILLYSKSADAPYEDVARLLAASGFQYIVLRYGSYSPEEYREVLSCSLFAVFLSRSESQGLALAEAWAMDVPTFVWNPGWFHYQGHVFSNVSAAPYLSAQTGQFWNGIHELRYAIQAWQNGETQYTPRAWVLANMTDCISAKSLVGIIFSERETVCAH